ncbi:hypothetical protein CFE70_003459 [Pyrenophora teres f. teres 0-1]|uniref:Uncharacterized protein n=2 Tax=Pyrenophora teres f. teres TaxID=97479 RepID=E3RLW4_PYRTT|nr:hypothetical protein PTT_09386 [Pyrenophora teres f. teres 0-1]KAE8846072.1 hypothetical protein HRS9139_00639 [Pyrenophora teres f. teres]KAE8848213.1 hypothetical protein PTNB85_02056 [Pyrenophora teres f. teres]KAE8853622.1 hypothetical protein HRS9122_00614 [Pyrenophora teres f. teres]KAE8868137.1 hypothetical protein PTNB29_02048 [Pyrenophora teres f. teres]
MPAQHTFMGRPVTLRMPPRRFQILLIAILFFIFNLTFYGPPSRNRLPTYDQVADAVKHPQAHVPNLGELPAVPNPFGPSAHKPPVQGNSTTASAYGAIEWLSDFKWRNPFSSSVTLDENKALLPPLRERTPIYTYYDVPKKQDKDVSAAEHRLILAWRRAWWAQGFKPVVLSRAEAMHHPQYQLFQRMKLSSKIEFEIMRWLAWGQMGGGILVNWLALPMAEYDNPMLNFLRRNEYPKLSRVQSLDNAVFFGERVAVNDALKKVMSNALLKNTTANKDKLTKLANKEGGPVVNLLASADVKVDAKANGIASYNRAVISSKYKTVADKLTNTTQAEGLDLLANLINSHLHLTWQEQHPEGVAIVKPLPEHTTALMYEATDFARNLTQCPTSPMPKTCPPNRPKCKPCDANKGMKLQVFPEFVNSTKFFSIGTVPHPYTLTSLHYTRDVLDGTFLRRNTKRDLWIMQLTDKSIPTEHTEEYRVLKFKELVAAAPAHTLWLTAERITQEDLDWIFGFGLPQTASSTKEPNSPSKESELIIFPRPAPPKPIQGIDVPDEKWIEKEEERLKKARDAIQSKDRNMKKIVEAVEQWNLADTEAWRFSRAYSARRRQERLKWEEEEAKYAGSEKKAGVRPGEGRGRWTDKR